MKRTRAAADAASGVVRRHEHADGRWIVDAGRRKLRRTVSGWARSGARALAAVAAIGLVALGGVASGAEQPRDQNAPSAAAQGDCVQDGTVSTGAVFNNPHAEDNTRIHEHLVCLIEGAPEGAQVKVGAYHFADESVVGALMDAIRRGVDVQIVVDAGVPDNSDDGPYYQEVADLIESEGATDSFIRSCPGPDRACIADRKMHSKLVTLSETHGVENVTFVTTSNLEDEAVDNVPDNPNEKNSGTFMWNSGFTAADDGPLYDWFANTYFADLSAEEPENLSYYEDNGLPKEIGDYRAYHSPRNSGNTVLDILNSVECHGNNSGGTDNGNRTIVRVSMLQFSHTDNVGTDIAKKLWDLDNLGCQVDIVSGDFGYGDDPDAGSPLRTLLEKPEAADDQTNYNGPEVREFSSGAPHSVHNKNLLIDGHVDGQPDQKVVFTGSFNFTRSSAGEAGPGYEVNDETWLQINNPSVHDQFAENFSVVQNAAHTCWQTTETEGCNGGRTQPPPEGELDCRETADEYQGAGNVYLYDGIYCDGGNDAKDSTGSDNDYGDGEGSIGDFDNKGDSIINTTDKHVAFYNYADYNEGHPEGDSFCIRPGQWVSELARYGDGAESWSNSISSHQAVDNPAEECERWLGGYHEPNR